MTNVHSKTLSLVTSLFALGLVLGVAVATTACAETEPTEERGASTSNMETSDEEPDDATEGERSRADQPAAQPAAKEREPERASTVSCRCIRRDWNGVCTQRYCR